MQKAAQIIDKIEFYENFPRPTLHQISTVELTNRIGDVVLARQDIGTSYHLAVTVDDAAQGVTLVTRGEDLFDATFVQVLLQHLLGFETPHYHHHPLVRDDQGKRLAKRDDARALSKYRAEGATPQDIRAMVGL
jgi:glutamyl-Q tRNA(Asp) synthetase